MDLIGGFFLFCYTRFPWSVFGLAGYTDSVVCLRWASKRPPASDHSAVIVSRCFIFFHLPELLLIIQQDTVYILLVLCWPDSKAVILIMVVPIGWGWISLMDPVPALCRFTGELFFFLLISLVFAAGEPLSYLSTRLPSVNSISVSLRHPHTLFMEQHSYNV